MARVHDFFVGSKSVIIVGGLVAFATWMGEKVGKRLAVSPCWVLWRNNRKERSHDGTKLHAWLESVVVTSMSRLFFPWLVYAVHARRGKSRLWCWCARPSVVAQTVTPEMPLAERCKNCSGAMTTPKPHAILRTGGEDATGMDNCPDGLALYIGSLASSPKKTMLKQVDRTFAQRGFKVVTHIADTDGCKLGWRHLACIIAHQHKLAVANKLAGKGILQFCSLLWNAVPLGCQRFLWSVWTSVGVIDEYWCGDEMLAFAQSHLRGNVMRCAWFYMRPEGSQGLIWFHAVRTAVERATAAQNIQWVDLGPSNDPLILELKTRCGFQHTDQWRTGCIDGAAYNYTGKFAAPAPVDSLRPVRET